MKITKKEFDKILLTEMEIKERVRFLREIEEDESFEFGLGYSFLSNDNNYYLYHGLDSAKKKAFEELCIELYSFGLLTGMRDAQSKIWGKVQDLIGSLSK